MKFDPDLIYQFVRNNIEYYPGWGLQKGAIGAILESQGTAADQANLMVALLRQSGFTAGYVKGQIELTAAQINQWLGVPTTDACAVARLFSSGGVLRGAIKSTVQGGTCPDGQPGNAGTLVSLRIGHVWVKANIGGTNYVFDPSFKPHTVKNGINIPSAAKFVPATYLSNAKAGAVVTAYSIEKINRTNIRNSLAAYSNNLAAYLRDNMPTATLEDVVGGKTIVPYHYGPLSRDVELPYQTNAVVEE